MQGKFLKNSLLPVGFMLVILLLTLLPIEKERFRFKRYLGKVNFSQFNDFMHFPFFGALAFMWMRLLRAYTGRARAFGWAMAITVMFGVIDELLQVRLPDRDASLSDFKLDCAGALVGALWGGIGSGPGKMGERGK